MSSLREKFEKGFSQPWVFGLSVLGVFALYFSVKTFDLSFLSAFGTDLAQTEELTWAHNVLCVFYSLFACLLLALATWRLGRRLGPLVGFSKMEGMGALAQWGLAILFLDGFWLAVGLNGLWRALLPVTLIVLWISWALVDYWNDPASPRGVRTREMTAGEWVFWVLVGLYGVLESLQLFIPVTYFDALVYHLSTLRFWQFHHGLASASGNFFTCYPYGAELYLWNGLVLGGTEAAKGLNILVFLLTAWGAGSWVAEEKGRQAGFLTAASVLFVPLFSTIVWSAQNDLFLAFFILLFAYAHQKALRTGQWRWFLLAGLLGGSAWMVKETAVLGLVVIGSMGWILERKDVPRRWSPWFGMALAALIPVLPWLLKNWAYMGNPFYPYFSQWFGGQIFSLEKTQALLVAHESPGAMGASFWEWIHQLFAHCLDRTIVPLLVAFLPLWFFSRSAKTSSSGMGWVGLLYLLLCFVVSYQLRLAAPAVVLVLTAIGLALDPVKVQRWFWVVLIFGSLSFLSLFRVSVSYFHWDKTALGTQLSVDFLEKDPQTQSYYALTEAVDEKVGAQDRILIVGDGRSLYYRRDFIANSLYDTPLLVQLARDEPDAEAIYRRLKERGVDDLVVSVEEGRRLAAQENFYPLTEPEWAKLDRLIQTRTELLSQSKEGAVYRLRSQLERPLKPVPDLLLALKSPVPKP